MAAPGWYQDPAGPPGQWRWWDGSVWTARITDDPSAAQAPPPKRGWAVLAMVGLVVVTVVVALFVWAQQPGGLPFGRGDDDPGREITFAPTPTITGWDERDPSSQPSPIPPPPPTPTPKPTALVSCEWSVHDNDPGTPQSVGGWNMSGKLMVHQIAGWDQWMSEALPPAFDFTDDNLTIYPGWFSLSGVGRLSADDGFDDPVAGAEMMMDCLTYSDLYYGFTGRTDITSEAVTISGHPGWHLRANVYVDLIDLPQVEGDVVDVIVVDLGRDLGVYASTCTIGDTRVCGQVRRAMATLQVSG